MNNNEKYRNALKDFFYRGDWSDFCAVTLTMKQGRQHLTEHGSFVECLDEIAASRNLRHFMNRLNYRVYGKRFQRHRSARLQVIPTFEYNKSSGLHFHLFLQTPDHISSEDYEELILSCWTKTPWGRNNKERQRKGTKIKFERDTGSPLDNGWIDYIIEDTYVREKHDEFTSRDFANVDQENLVFAG